MTFGPCEFDLVSGPGKHLKGLTLMDGIVKPEEFDYFREFYINQMMNTLQV